VTVSTQQFLLDLRSKDIILWAEGDRLRCSAPKGALTSALREELNQRKAELLAFLHLARQTSVAEKAPPLVRIARDGVLPLSFGQQRLWFLHELDGGSTAYNIQFTVLLTGHVDIKALRWGLEGVVKRHEILRTAFPAINGQPRQRIANQRELNLSIENLQSWPVGQRQSQVKLWLWKERRKPFDLARGPLLRVLLLRLEDGEHILILTMHHTITDGWSMSVLFDELGAFYSAFTEGEEVSLTDLPIQYADYAAWQRQWLSGDVLEAQLQYWKDRLANPPTLQLPADRPRPAVQTFQGARESEVMPQELSKALGKLSQREGVTLFMTLLAAFAILLHRYTGQDDIVLASPIANRNRPEIERLIGFFVNMLVMRTDVSGDPTFRQLLARVREMTLGAYQHQDLPFEKLVEELQPERDMSRSPIFQVTFALQNAPMPPLELGNLTLSLLPMHVETTRFDLEVDLWESKDGLSIRFIYNTDLFDAVTIRRMLRHFQVLLEGIAADPDRQIANLPLMRDAEQRQLLVEWNQTTTDYPNNKAVHELFEDRVDRNPDAIAVVFGDQKLTYQELNTRANQLAHHLQHLGVGPEVLVGICAQRSLEMVVGVLGILKAGGAYMPLDPDYPKQRLAFMLEDMKVPVLLTQASLKDQLPNYPGTIVCLDSEWKQIAVESTDNLRAGATANNLAYVIYTSGSTGQPKGSCIEHRSVVRLVKETNYVELGPQEVFLQFAPISFDASTFELWGSLLNGAKLVVFPPHRPSLEELGEFIQKEGITTLWLTAALFHQMVDGQLETLTHVRQILAGGEALSVPHVQKMIEGLGNHRLINGYGPTENTTFTACHVMTAASRIGRSVPIGVPISNTQVYILDRHMQPVPVGVCGELYIGGDGLAREYLNRPALTAERFISHPFSDEPGARLYKTGDTVCYLQDGSIEFLGRVDHQVKIRGFRVELGEIEATLAQHPAVKETVVLCREDQPGDKRLVAYMVGADVTFSADDLRNFLRKRLPEYMVPAAFVVLDALPLTPIGKIDRKALPVLDGTRPEMDIDFIPPRTGTEQSIAAIWRELLQIEDIGIYDDFFELGGHSLLATQVMSRLSAALNLELPLHVLFESSTIDGLAKYVDTTIRMIQGRTSSKRAATGRNGYEEGEI
jgi:aspartate racemase